MYSKIYVYCPLGYDSGGPEALHQLVAALRLYGEEAFLVPVPGTERKTPVRRFDRYRCPQVALPEDSSRNAVVAPESAPQVLRGLRRATRMCWWLSVDNAAAFRSKRQIQDFRGGLWGAPGPLKTAGHVASAPWRRTHTRFLADKSIVHLAQSHYARAFVFARFGALAGLLTDYVVCEEVDVSVPDRTLIAYNPAKGGQDVVDELTRVGWHPAPLMWAPIRGLSRLELAHTLAKTALYLDFGAHPGRDRLPREAAMMGSVVMVARRGAAAFYADVPIPARYKVAVDTSASALGAFISETVRDREMALSSQADYRRGIEAERARFMGEVERTFRFGVQWDDSPTMTSG